MGSEYGLLGVMKGGRVCIGLELRPDEGKLFASQLLDMLLFGDGDKPVTIHLTGEWLERQGPTAAAFSGILDGVTELPSYSNRTH